MSEITLLEHDFYLIRREGETHYPEECCGFLYGATPLFTGGTQGGATYSGGTEERFISEVIPMRNEQDSNRTRRFLISPDEFRKAESYAHETGQELLGFYHTHPDHPAIPSEFDREHALPFYSYLILSVRQGQAAELHSWQLDPDRKGYVQENLKIKSEVLQ